MNVLVFQVRRDPYVGFHSIIESPHTVETVRGGRNFQQSLHVSLHNFVMLAISILKYCDCVMIICVSERETSNCPASISHQLCFQLAKLLDSTQVGVGMYGDIK